MKKVFLVILTLTFLPLIALAYTFSQDLTLGSSGNDVIELQNILIDENLLVMPQAVSQGYFGSLTQQALQKYQVIKGISPALGYFGPLTRNVVNSQTTTISIPNPITAPIATEKNNVFDQTVLFNKQITKKDADAPLITKVSTMSAKINERITVEGENFGNTLTIYSSVGTLEGKKVKNNVFTFNFSEILGNLSEISGMAITFSVGNTKGISTNYGYVVIE